MTIRLLDAFSNGEAWTGVLKRFPHDLQDIYFTLGYARLHHSLSEGTQCVLFVFEESDLLWIHPFWLTPITKVGGEAISQQWFDIESFYGYGGPLTNTNDSNFLAAAYQAYSSWCKEQGVVAEFIRSHPVIGNHRWFDPSVEVIYDRGTVSLDLAALDNENLPFSRTARNKLRRAFQNRLQPKIFSPEDHFLKLKELAIKSGWLVAVEHESQ